MMKIQYKLFAFLLFLSLYSQHRAENKKLQMQKIDEDKSSADTTKTEENVVQFSQEQYQNTGIELGKIQM
ncbi:MAG: hypothetical protein IPJ20_17685 [Flammeovirgaceae bacterium]|nr:hypothetical protein [Flammeovirgaceae bacterium]